MSHPPPLFDPSRTFTRLRLLQHGAVLQLTLDNPANRNAFCQQMREELDEVLHAVALQPAIRALVLHGAHGQFCSGGDIRGMQENAGRLDGEGWNQRMRALHPFLHQLIHLDRPVIAAVQGAAYGAGFSLALAADFVLAAPDARFCLSFMRLGLVPDCGAFYTLPRIVGVQRAKELMLSARELRADEAQSLGIVLEQHPADALLPRALELAQALATASPWAVAQIKRALADPGALGAALDREADAQALAFGTSAHQTARQRFLSKQAPAFAWPAPPPAPGPAGG